MTKKTLLSPRETFLRERAGEFLDPGINIPVPQAASFEERASMEAEFERRSRAAELQAQGPGSPSPAAPTEASPRIVFLPVKDLEVSPWNARPAPLDGEALKELRYAISREGVKSPLHAYPIPDKPGRYAILDGQRRFRAALSLNLREVPVILYEPPDPEKAYTLSYMLSKTGEKPSLLDNALMWKKFLDEGIAVTHEDLSLLLGVTRSMITRTLRFHQLSQESQGFLLDRREPVSWRTLDSLCKAELRYGADKVLQAISTGEGNLDQSLLQLDRAEAQPKRRYARTTIREPIVWEDAVIGTVHRAKSRLTVDLPHLEFDDELARRVVDAVKTSLLGRLK